MRSQFGGVPVEQPTSRFGGIPVAQPAPQPARPATFGETFQAVAGAPFRQAQRTIQEIPGFISRTGEDLRQRGAQLADIQAGADIGSLTGQGLAETAFQVAGTEIGALGDIIGQLITSGARALPQEIQQPVKQAVQSLVTTEIGQQGLEALSKGVDAFNKWEIENPRAGRNLRSAFNIGALAIPIKGVSGAKVLAPPIKEGVKATANVTRDTANAIIKTTQAVDRIVSGRDADKILASRIKVDEALDALGELKAGKISVLADVAGDEIRGLTRAVGKVKGGARNIVADALEGRSEAAVGRVSSALSKDISNVDNYFTNLDDLSKARSSLSRPFYVKAYKQGKQLKLTTRLNTLLNDQRIVTAMDQAKATLGVSAEARRNSVEALDGVKKILDDRIGQAITNNQGQLVTATNNLKKELTKEVDRQVPSYAKARKIFSDFKSLEDAQKLGLDFTKQTPEQLKIILSAMDNTQKEAFKIGVRENLQRTVSKTADQADPAKRVFGNEFKRNQLKTIFGEGNQFEEFSKAMREEIRAADTKFKVIRGSRSDINLTDDGQFIQAASQAVKQGAIRTTLDKTINAIADAAQRRWVGLDEKSAKDLATILTDREAGIEALQRLIDNAPKSQKMLLRDAINETAGVN